jgi:hypothetical protein
MRSARKFTRRGRPAAAHLILVRRMRVLKLIVVAVPLVTSLAAETPVKEPSVRVICQHEWTDDMLQHPVPQSGRAFDIVLPVTVIPSETTVAYLAVLARTRAGVRTLGDFIHRFRIYRQSETKDAYRLVEHGKLRDAETIRVNLRDGDIVVFHGAYDRF